ncbi:Glycosyl transferase group 1 [uncultured Sporomusa sp.]|uniref:Glycosyl transferase group 1 n=1 Tax=uncultured Sporomusa sp. TaxID=307249 RepID=A0A212M1B9_9FIRM|nr:glycosyltransferase family 4 protein [uncultured Sporomusa sp.]SCM83614.1 Glycosyl transferase group 1 [uncultured Sporomusa sp.]
MAKLNILLVVPRLNIGGAESYVLTTALGLTRRGYQVCVASWGGQLVDKLAALGIKHYLVPIRLNSYLSSWLLEYIIKTNNISLVHANSAAAGFAALKVCQRMKVPLVYTAHGVFDHNKSEKVLANADKIICVSEFLRRRCLANGIPDAKLVTIYNGIDLAQFSPVPGRAFLAKREFGIPDDVFVIGMISRIKNLHTKGHGDILQMLGKYRNEKTKNWRLLIVGKGNGLSQVKHMAGKLGLSEQVYYAGHQTDIPKLMELIDVLLLPSDFETFGLVLAEAMAGGKPAIAYEVGGTPEAIDDKITGFLTPKNDIDAIYSKLDILYDNPSLRQQLGQNGIARVRALFDSETMLKQLLAVYEEVMIR